MQDALDSFAGRQHTQEESQKTREDLVAENREKRLKDIRDKMKAKQDHAEAVRRRKKIAPIQIAESPRSGATSARSIDSRPLSLSAAGYSADTSQQW